LRENVKVIVRKVVSGLRQDGTPSLSKRVGGQLRYHGADKRLILRDPSDNEKYASLHLANHAREFDKELT
jgi:hypothetical protein